MGLRPIERHPSRIINRGNNSLFFDILEHTRLPVSEIDTECDCTDEACKDNWDGVTHVHVLDSGNGATIQMKTHYDAAQSQYSLLEYVVFIDTEAETSVKTIVKRGETSEQIKERMGEQEEPSDEHMAAVISMFKEINT